MMQIDCEVTDTQWLHVQEAVIPKHLRSQQRQPETDSPKDRGTGMSDETPNTTTKAYEPYFPKDNSTASLNDDNFKHDEYAAEGGKALYDDKAAYPARENFDKNFHNAVEANIEEKDRKSADEFTNKVEESQKYPQDRRIFRRKTRLRSTLQ